MLGFLERAKGATVLTGGEARTAATGFFVEADGRHRTSSRTTRSSRTRCSARS